MSRFTDTIYEQPVRTFALFCVACTSAYLGVLAWRLINTLSSPRWCAYGLQAEKVSDQTKSVGMEACVDLLTMQLKALATNSHIVIGSFSLGLLVLVVIVLAGARLSGTILGNKLDMSREQQQQQIAEEAATHVADKAQEGVEDIRGGGVT